MSTRNKRSRHAFIAAVLLGMALVAVTSTASAQQLELTYNIAEAKSYAYKISVTKEVIQADGLAPCDPAKDDFGCDVGLFAAEPNCPATIAKGPAGNLPAVTPLDGGNPVTGGSGQTTGTQTTGTEPPGASPVKINELVSVGKLQKSGPVLGAGGLASDTLVDLSGRANPYAHTESDAFVSNKEPYQERCDPAEGDSYVHVFSRSGATPETYHFAECWNQKCSQSGSTQGRPNFQHAISIIHLYESGGKVLGRAKALVSDMTLGSGAESIKVKQMASYLAFESDGTPGGLTWSANSTASNITFLGTPAFTLQQGQTVQGPSIPCVPGVSAPCGPTFLGLAGPYIVSTDDGLQITMIAPGMFYGTEVQTTYVAGAELRAGMGRAPAFSFTATPQSDSPLGLVRPGPPPFTGGETGSLGALPPAPPAPGEAVEGEPLTISVSRLAASPLPLAGIVGFGILSLIVVIAGWIQRFGWGRKVFSVQPLRSFNWMYRAFVRT